VTRRAPEKAVQGAVTKALKTLGFHVSDLSQPRASMQTPGLPDLYAMHAQWKVAFWVEVKAPGGRLSRGQEAWHREAHASGVRVMTVDSVAALVSEMSRIDNVPISEEAAA
jgi:hypothetical protein